MFKNKLKIIILALILLAIISRFLWLDKTAFFVSDQGRDMMVLHNIVINKSLTLIGPATSFAGNYGNIYFGPYYYYFLLPFYLLNNQPYFITSIFPLLFILGLILFFKIKELKSYEKIIISLLLISSSFSLYYTRFIWNLNLAFLLSFILFSIFLIYRKKITVNGVLMLVFGIASGAIFQMHYAMFFLYICLPIFFWKSWKNLLLYASGFIVSFFPFVLFDIRHSHVLSRNIYSLVVGMHPQIKTANFTFLQIFEKVFNYLLVPSINLYPLIKSLFMMGLYLFTIYFYIRQKKILNHFIALIFIVFLISFSIFKRDFDYYLACFYIWFYIGAG
ncbi:MAG: hypothetical protein NTV98_02155, partial [Candidatus Roizmanbacteria bacterium]|nr:hypothetical protein [Candidatus Roizmanbacteria bacterium]